MGLGRRFFLSTIKKETALPFISTWRTTNTSVGSTALNQVKLPLISAGTYNFVVNWGDGNSDTITTWNQAQTTHTYTSSGDYTITITGNCRGWQFANTGDRLKILTISQWGILTFTVSNSPNTGAFQGCSNLNVTATDTPVFLSGGQQGFFRACASLVGNSSFANWDVSMINNMVRFFDGCTNFNQNINNWDVSNVTNCDSMFLSCANYNQPMNNWDVGACTFFGQMFRSASIFNQNIGSWNTSAGQTFAGMFNLASAFNNGGSDTIKNWNVSNGQVFSSVNNGLFQSATAFTQPIGDWNVSKATNLQDIMRNKTSANYSATNLDEIYNKWSLLTFVNTGLTANFGTIKYTSAGSAGRAILTGAPNNWTITDGGI